MGIDTRMMERKDTSLQHETSDFILLSNNLFIYQVLCTVIYRRRSLNSFLKVLMVTKCVIPATFWIVHRGKKHANGCAWHITVLFRLLMLSVLRYQACQGNMQYNSCPCQPVWLHSLSYTLRRICPLKCKITDSNCMYMDTHVFLETIQCILFIAILELL